MNIRILFSCIAFLFSILLAQAQEVRSIDGTGNNLSLHEMGAINTELARMQNNGYANGFSTPGGQARKNPRIISNLLFEQNGSMSDVMGLSDFLWTFGQFIDHDIIATGSNPAEPAMIPVNFVDQHFNPSGNLNVEIPMFRSIPAPGTGTGPTNPRNNLNEITAWLDASAVYGSDTHRSSWLRSFSDGKLKTSAGNLLPWNTFSGEFGSDVDPTAPEMADDVGMAPKLFVAGDIRANEQPLLLACHTVFVREHNRLCEEIILNHPNWTDEQIYQEARRWVGAFFQSIVFNEWLVALGVQLQPYAGYDSSLDASIQNVFASAAFRLGHTLINGTINRTDANGNTIPEGNLTLAQGFFNPSVIQNFGLDPYFQGMGSQVEQSFDCKIVDEVRNFLFGPPGAGGLDLASININRGRERGLPNLNSIRFELGLTPYSSFSEIHSDPQLVQDIENAYESNIDEIDAWVGMLSEEPMANALIGETIMEVLIRQFSALRDGDRFFYKNDPAFDMYDRMIIDNTTFKDIIMRNTGITLMQENVFMAMDYGDICNASNPVDNIVGQVTNQNGIALSDVNFSVLDKDLVNLESIDSDANGNFAFQDMATCNYYKVKAERNTTDFRNGVTVLDLVLIARQIVQLDPPAPQINLASADVDGDFILSAFDLIEIQKMILFATNEFPNQVPSWRMVPEYVINSGVDAYPNYFHPVHSLGILQGATNSNWIGFKMGDFSQDAAGNFNDPDDNAATSLISLSNKNFKEGELVQLELPAHLLSNVYGLQLSLDFNKEYLDFQNNSSADHLMVYEKEDRLDLSWYQATMEKNQPIMLNFTAKKDGDLASLISLSSSNMDNKLVDATMEEKSIILNFEDKPSQNELMVYQNIPNPFSEITTIAWNQPDAGKSLVEVFSSNGDLLQKFENQFEAGLNQISFNATDFGGTGLLLYRISNSTASITKRMTVLQ